MVIGLIRGAIKKMSVKDIMDKLLTEQQKAELRAMVVEMAKAAIAGAVQSAINKAHK